MLTRFRLGEFDTHNPENPHRGPWDESMLDGPTHRALARSSMAASVVLLQVGEVFLGKNEAEKRKKKEENRQRRRRGRRRRKRKEEKKRRKEGKKEKLAK